MLEDIEDGLVDVVVVYKIDRSAARWLTSPSWSRCLTGTGDLRLGDAVVQYDHVHGAADAEHPAVFAQFEREVTAERIRDKVAASRKKGMWMGGVPLRLPGENRKLVVDEEAAAHVRWIFARFLEIGSCTELAREVGTRGIRTPRGNRIDKKYIYRMLSNRAYIGEAVHKGQLSPASTTPSSTARFGTRFIRSCRRARASAPPDPPETPALLKGLLFGPDGAAFSPTHTRKGDKLYRYYVSQSPEAWRWILPIGRVSAGEIEAAVIDQLRAVFRQPEIVAGTWKAARAHAADISEADARTALQQLDPLWDELFPAEQARIVALLVERVDIGTDGLNVRLRVDGLGSLALEMLVGGIEAAA
ncbi:MAG: recombinase family protein [Rhodobacteraceae bacterium]|nr:recombinase family protein [Paracoccaceae bacterium]